MCGGGKEDMIFFRFREGGNEIFPVSFLEICFGGVPPLTPRERCADVGRRK